MNNSKVFIDSCLNELKGKSQIFYEQIKFCTESLTYELNYPSEEILEKSGELSQKLFGTVGEKIYTENNYSFRKLKFEHNIMMDQQLFSGLNNKDTQSKTIVEIEKKIRKLNGAIFISKSTLDSNDERDLDRMQIYLPGKECDTVYVLNIPQFNGKNSVMRVDQPPVDGAIKICHKDPNSGKRLPSSLAFFNFFGASKVNGINHYSLGSGNNIGICKGCHNLGPYKNPSSLQTIDSFDNVKNWERFKDKLSKHNGMDWGVFVPDKKGYKLERFFSSTDLLPTVGPSNSYFREQVLNECIPPGKPELLPKIREGMDCSRCHDGAEAPTLNLRLFDHIENHFEKEIGRFIHSKHMTMPPKLKLNNEEKSILTNCLEKEFTRYLDYYSKRDCIPPQEIQKSCDKSPVRNLSSYLENFSFDTINQDSIRLKSDTSLVDPDNNFNNNVIKETRNGFKRAVFGNLCTSYCNPSNFEIEFDKSGKFKKIVTNKEGQYLQKVDHQFFNPKQVKILNKFIKEKLKQVDSKGELLIRKWISNIKNRHNLEANYKIDAVTGATKIKTSDFDFKLPKELKGSMNTVLTALLYAFDTQNYLNLSNNSK